MALAFDQNLNKLFARETIILSNESKLNLLFRIPNAKNGDVFYLFHMLFKLHRPFVYDEGSRKETLHGSKLNLQVVLHCLTGLHTKVGFYVILLLHLLRSCNVHS